MTMSFRAPEDVVTAGFHLPVHQRRAWVQLSPPTPAQRYIAVDADDGSVSCLVRLRRVGFGLSFASIQRGPMTPAPEDLRKVMPLLEDELRARGAITLSVNPYWTDGDAPRAEAILREAGYRRVSRDLQNFHTWTVVVPLPATEAEQLACMTRTGRRALRKAWQMGVVTRPMASALEACEANQIMSEMAAQTGMLTDAQHDFAGHFKYLSRYPGAGCVYVSEYQGRILGASVSYVEGRRGYNFLLATRSSVDLPRSYDLIWHSARRLRQLGCTQFDLAGLPDPHIDADDGARGRAEFKLRFTRQDGPVVPIMTKALRPGLHSVLERARALSRSRRRAALRSRT